MSHWAYRGEGNAHIVVSHKQKHIVYRMFKRKKNGISTRKKFKTDYQHLREKVLKYLAFTRNVMLPRIDRKYLHCGSLVEISPRLAQSIKASLANRPEYRKDKELDENCPYVLEMPDYCHVNQTLHNNNGSLHAKLTHPVYTIEIKPKWGFLPSSEYISASNRIKYSVCRYCMHQYQKIATGKWKHHSYYCPLDLFSGDKARMKHALQMLFTTPQNNLRIFKDGKVLWNDLTHALRDNSEEIFLREFCQHSDLDNSQDIKSYRSQFDGFLELLVQCLLHDDIPQTGCDSADPTPRSTVIQNGCDHLPDSETFTNGHVFNSNLQECYIKRHDEELLAQTCAASTYKKQNGYNSDPAVNKSKVSGLPKGCVLSQVLKVQLLDDIDIEGIQPLYEMVKQEMEEAKLQGRRCPLDVVGPYDANWCPTGAAPYTDTPDRIMYAVNKIKQFLVSRSAKDCSIMISIQQYADSTTSRPVLQQHVESAVSRPVLQQHLESAVSRPVLQQHVESAVSRPVLQQHVESAVSRPVLQQHVESATSRPVLQQHVESATSRPVLQQHVESATSRPVLQQHVESATSRPVLQQHVESAASRPVLLESSSQPLATVPSPESPPPVHGAPESDPTLPTPLPTAESTDPALYICPDTVQRSTSQKSDSSFLAIDSEGQRHLASIAVIDLDPKPFDRLPSYMEEDREVVQAYLQYLCSRGEASLL